MKYTISMRVDGRIDIEVDADSVEEAFEKAEERWQTDDFDFNKMDIVDSEPVNCTDENGDLTDYR